MNRSIFPLFASLLLTPIIYAVDLHDASCAQFKALITQASPTDLIQRDLISLCSTLNLSEIDRAILEDQAKQYAYEIKNTLEQELTALGNAKYHTSMLVSGALKSIFGLWSVSIPLVTVISMLTHIDPQYFNFVMYDHDAIKYLSNFKNFFGKFIYHYIRQRIPGIPLMILVRIVAIWCGVKGISQIKLALDHKATLTKNIDNLNELIIFLKSAHKDSEYSRSSAMDLS